MQEPGPIMKTVFRSLIQKDVISMSWQMALAVWGTESLPQKQQWRQQSGLEQTWKKPARNL